MKNLSSNLPISAIIMAGGKGTRLLPLTSTIPKPLLKINGKPIIEGIIELLFKYNITDISVSVCYLAEAIIEFLESDSSYSNINILHENSPLDDIGILGACERNVFLYDTILVINADLFTNINLSDFYFSFLTNHADMSIATVIYKTSLPYGLISSENGEVIRIDEKPILEMEANGGIYLLKKELIDLIPVNKPYKAWQLISKLLTENRHKLRVFLIKDIWVDIGSKENYAYAEKVAKA